MKITLVGLGSAEAPTLTLAAQSALSRADVVIGAQRLLSGIDTAAEKRPAVRTEDIMNIISTAGAEHICVVLSGDTGFYSGAAKLSERLAAEGMDCTVLPGLSSVQLLSAALRRPWQNWKLVSAHGTDCDCLAAVCEGKETFFLTSGADSPAAICRELCAAGLGALRVTVGENLGTENENILCGTAAEFSDKPFASLNVMLCAAAPTLPRRTPGIADDEFIRATVPMTKQEVRAAVLSKLAVRETDICWDVGAGTGSVSVELALNSARTYAVETKQEACELIRANREKFCAWKMRVVEGHAPEALAALPTPDAVFIGGSGGELSEIIDAALAKNPAARICVSAIALETLSAAMDCMTERGMNPEITQISVSRTKPAGSLHLLMAQNPIFLITGKAGENA